MARSKTRGNRKILRRKQKRRTRRKSRKGKKRTTRRKKGGMFKKNDKVKYKEGKCKWKVVSYDGATESYQLIHLDDKNREVNTPAKNVSGCDEETNIPPPPQLRRQPTMLPPSETKSTSPPTLPQGPQNQFEPIKGPIFTRESDTPSPYEEAQEWVKKQTNEARSMSRNLHELIAKKREKEKKERAKSTPPNMGGTRKRRRRKHKKRRKTKRR